MSSGSTSNSFNNNSFNIGNTGPVGDVWGNCTIADHRPELLAWLSPLEPQLRHQDVRKRRVDGVGEWLVQTEEFRRWCGLGEGAQGDKAVLFGYGDPGVGKTFISSLVADRLHDQLSRRTTTVPYFYFELNMLCNHISRRTAAITCFYFDFAARREQSTTSVLGSLAKQVVGEMEEIPEEISRAFEEQKKAIGGRRLQLVEVVKMLQLITSLQSTFICIDALDECVGAQRVRLLTSLKKILETSPGTRIFVTGRPHIRSEVEKSLAGHVVCVSLSPAKDDVITYIRDRLGSDETPDAMDEGLEADILKKIPENTSEMFRLVSLNIDAILQESTIYRRRKRLCKMIDGVGLEDAYGATIERIKAQGGDRSRLGMAALMWISHAERPLRADEFCHALATELGSTDFDATDVPSISTLVGCCQSLITVDKESSTVRLIHFTLQQYLSAHPDIFGRPHSVIAEICLIYLNSHQVKVLSATASPGTRGMPFLEYCSLYWGVHAKREPSNCATSLALELFQEYNSHISAKLLLEEAGHLDPGSFNTSFSFSGLHCASFFGAAEVVAALIEMGDCDINGGDLSGYTPLAWAAHNGHGEVVKILLRQEAVNPDKPDNSGRTPVSHAASNGHEGVAKILRRGEVNPNKRGNDDQTPLMSGPGYKRVKR